ncbi:HERC4 isoform 5 [Pan troglodytes]|uniref:HERC4 isoform 5 n=2 Tax=Homininae TaxID=207598 RepID=A0A2J8NV82_PANTR|nr:HECT and RCC1 containing protein 4 isoform 2 [Homo sapiens]KAI2555955.1 HECT and RLD domain containing E3 ubiquitin protein ligase 4 [Homo sapiens]KAI4076138.1 HECT and RLD domain containing E3 ubiquitin protein ligase 4 [Homo sapiens]PNI75672.1 HERC4 isoform 5 [Pan troglodytes]
MLCWGNASFGQLGLGGIDEEIVLEPRKSDFFINKRVRDVGCGLRHTVFVLDDGTVYTCGCNDLGQLGHEKSRKKPEILKVCQISRLYRLLVVTIIHLHFLKQVKSSVGDRINMANWV